MSFSEGVIMKDEFLGVYFSKLDYKHRVNVPSFYGAEAGDELLLVAEGEYLSVYEKNHFKQKMIDSYSDSLVDSGNFLVMKRVNEKIFSNVFAVVKVDKQKRILLPKLVVDYYQLHDEVIMKGCDDHINLYGSKEIFDKYSDGIKLVDSKKRRTLK